MHIENDTATRDNTLALWGAKHHSPTYYRVRFAVRTLIVAIPLVGGLIWNMV